MKQNPERRLLRLLRDGRVIRAEQAGELGVPRVYLTRLVRRGVLRRPARGLYILAEAKVTEHHSLAEAATKVEHGTICLLSALQFHGFATPAPAHVWMAVGPRARAAQVANPPLRFVRMSGLTLKRGIRHHTIDGVSVPIYSVHKTIADCFKFRSKIGLDIALEALRQYRHSSRWDADELWRYAALCRVANVMRPYLEAIG
jgi:predicted transcriptional regulator of viral defense system